MHTHIKPHVDWRMPPREPAGVPLEFMTEADALATSITQENPETLAVHSHQTSGVEEPLNESRTAAEHEGSAPPEPAPPEPKSQREPGEQNSG